MPGKLLVVVFLWMGFVHGWSQTIEGSALGNIQAVMESYRKEHGQLPTTWEDLKPYYEIRIDEEYRSVKPTQRYVFLNGPDVRGAGGRIVLISRSAFRDNKLWWGPFGHGLTEPGRYVIEEGPTGELNTRFLMEPEVAQLFAGAKVGLPEPDRVGPRTQEKRPRDFLIPYALSLVILFCGLGLVYVETRPAQRNKPLMRQL